VIGVFFFLLSTVKGKGGYPPPKQHHKSLQLSITMVVHA